MWHQGIKVAVLLFLSGLISVTTSYATPGERYFVQEDNTNIYEAPSANSPIVMRLNQDDRVIEWRRQGSWVKISRLGSVGNEGWVKISRISPEVTINQFEIELNSDNQFLVEAKINGKIIVFVVDTGATTTLLNSFDAKKVGFEAKSLKFSLSMQGIGGIISTALVNLDKVKIDRFLLRDVNAVVTKKSSMPSLLGINFLKRLESYEVRDDRLVLRW